MSPAAVSRITAPAGMAAARRAWWRRRWWRWRSMRSRSALDSRGEASTVLAWWNAPTSCSPGMRVMAAPAAYASSPGIWDAREALADGMTVPHADSCWSGVWRRVVFEHLVEVRPLVELTRPLQGQGSAAHGFAGYSVVQRVLVTHLVPGPRSW